MTSICSSLSYQYKLLTNAKNNLKKQLAERNHGAAKDMVPPKKLKKRHRIQADAKSGHPVYYVDFEKSANKPCILYFHGGTFLTGLARKHWRFVKWLLFGTGCPVVIPDYPLIPEYSHKGILSFCVETYLELAEKCPHGVILVGDSAGANLAMAVTRQALQKRRQKPDKLLLLSPYLDLTSDNPIKNVLAHRDPVRDPASSQEAALLYAGSRPLDDPLISPVSGSLKDFPKVTVWTGDNDILYADTLLLKDVLKKSRTPYHIYIYPGMTHGWMFERIPEGRKALRQIVLTVREYL